jgi:tRNA nucleotidyltransferase/poly(A) polymerase
MEPAAIQPISAPYQLEWPSLLTRVHTALPTAPLWIVGGAVRDVYLRRIPHDLDFVTADDGRTWARKIANKLGGDYYPLDDERKTGRAIVDWEGERYCIDVAQLRGPTLLADLTARDFTMNAIAAPLEGDLQTLLDPLNGLADLNQKRLRRCSPTALGDDPVRALRGIRQSIAFGLRIEVETRKDIRREGQRLPQLSAERVRDEFLNMLGGKTPHVALRVLDTLGLLKLIVPEIEAMRNLTQGSPHSFDVFEHTLMTVEKFDGVLTTISPKRTDETAAEVGYGMIVYLLDRFRTGLQDHLAQPFANGRKVQALLALGLLLHDCGKASTAQTAADGTITFAGHEIAGATLAEERAMALRLSNEEIARVRAIVRHHTRLIAMMRALGHSGEPPSRRMLHRFWNRTENAGLDIVLTSLADYLGIYGPNLMAEDWIRFVEMNGHVLNAWFGERDTIISPAPLIRGRELMDTLGLTPGPEVGRLLRILTEAHAAGEISTTAEAIALAKRELESPSPESDE